MRAVPLADGRQRHESDVDRVSRREVRRDVPQRGRAVDLVEPLVAAGEALRRHRVQEPPEHIDLPGPARPVLLSTTAGHGLVQAARDERVRGGLRVVVEALVVLLHPCGGDGEGRERQREEDHGPDLGARGLVHFFCDYAGGGGSQQWLAHFIILISGGAARPGPASDERRPRTPGSTG